MNQEHEKLILIAGIVLAIAGIVVFSLRSVKMLESVNTLEMEDGINETIVETCP